MADFLACHKQSYVHSFDMVSEIKPGGTFLLNCRWKGEEVEKNLPNRAKRILAERGIKFYTIDATDIAEQIGLGNRTSTVLQAAFFKLSGVLPIDQAEQYMKEAAFKSFSKKGEKVVQMNYQAIEQGLTAMVEIPVKPEWKDLEDEVQVIDESLPEYVKQILIPANAATGDDIPVSAYVDYDDGVMPTATAKYEKRGVADNVPVWDIDKCIGCNQCSLVCPHAAIRPFLFTEEEAAAAPCATKESKALKGLRYRIQVDVMDCQGCRSCANVCPKDALTMAHLDDQVDEQKNWDYCINELSEKPNPANRFSPMGSQFEQPLYEFSGACPGCGETPYVKLLTQLFGDRMYVANATGCTQAVGFFAPAFPQAVTKRGFGPAFSNSLFENNAEFALGMRLSMDQLRAQLTEHATAALEETKDADLKAALEAWLAEGNIEEKTVEISDRVRDALAKNTEDGPEVTFVRKHTDQLTRKSIWMYGGDGWAYDIGFGGLDHVIATGEDVNVLIVDTEVYSNTGGQSSKATPVGAVAQFAAAGKKQPKKDIGSMLMTYGNIYVAQVAMGADNNQLLKAVREAQDYKGPSVIIAYAPCQEHGLKCGTDKVQDEMKKAVDAGYWFLYRYNPETTPKFHLDSKEPSIDYEQFLDGEVRYNSLRRTFPENAKKLFAEGAALAKERYEKYKSMTE